MTTSPLSDAEIEEFKRVATERMKDNHYTWFCPTHVLRLIAEIKVARKALKPFAKMADELDEWQKGTGDFTGQFDANDLRRARQALPSPENRDAAAGEEMQHDR